MEENKSSRAFLTVAVGLGVLAAVLAFVYLQSKGTSEVGPTVKIMTAKRDLRANTSLDPDKDLAELDVPDNIPKLKERALLPADAAMFKGQRVNHDIVAGMPVLRVDFVAPTPVLLGGEGRALAIAVRGANALSGFLDPGDYVKLLVTRPLTHARVAPTPTTDQAAGPAVSSAPNWETIIVTPNALKVLAVGSRHSRAITNRESYETASPSESNQSVTLEVTEAQALEILAQTAAGQLTVTLISCPAPTTAP